MSNIEYLRQLHHKNLNLKRAQFRVKEFHFYEKDIVCSVLRKGLVDLYIHCTTFTKRAWALDEF